MTAFETILYHKDSQIAWVTLNRPHVLNAYNLAMRDELSQVLEAIRDDPEIHGAILCGSGDRAFCAGADLKEFGTSPSQTVARQVRWERDTWGMFLDIKKPIVAAVHGYVFGSGLEMALLCDIRVASDDSCFGLPETTLGMIPSAGGTQTLPRTVGRGPALEILLTGQCIDANQAYEFGLVTCVVSPKRLLLKAKQILERVVNSNSSVTQSIKVAVMDGMDMPLSHGLALEARMSIPFLLSQR